jgi:hypothetical protein
MTVAVKVYVFGNLLTPLGQTQHARSVRFPQRFTETTVAGVRDPATCHALMSEGNHWQQTGIGWKATYDKVSLRATPLAKVLRAPRVVNL